MGTKKGTNGQGSPGGNLAGAMKNIAKIEGGSSVSVEVDAAVLKKMKLLEFVGDDGLVPALQEAVAGVIRKRFDERHEQLKELVTAMTSIEG